MGSCFFIGHRETPDQVYPALLETIEHHITEYGVSEFVVGRYGNFDRLVIWALSQAKRAHPDITLMLMTPYYPVNRKVDLPEAFDALFYPPDLETVPKRLAIVRANRYMVERSDFLIAYVRHPASNAREPERKPPTTSTSINPAVTPKAYNKRRALLSSGRCEDVCECECAMTSHPLIILT